MSSACDAGGPSQESDDEPAPRELFATAPAQAPIKQLALGRAHGCSLDAAISGVLCWGDNTSGQTDVPWLLKPTFVAAGGDVSCAIASGRVKCWGDNKHRQRVVPRSLRKATQVAVGGAHVCALSAADSVRCWGDNSHGQLDVPPLEDVQSIVAGARHSCALAADGVVCWGDNSLGQLDVPALESPTQIAAGGDHGCAIDAGKVVCWGGDAAALRDEIPTVNEPSVIATGSAHACVLDADGVQCWGDPAAGDLTPRELTRTTQLAVGGGDGLAHACARHQQGVACWGDDSLGQTEYDGKPLHVLYHSESDIAAPPSLVWDILMDLDGYPEWNPYTIAMKSTLKIGDPMVMKVKMSPLITLEQTEHIRVLEPGHKVCWGIETTTPELNSGERCQWLEPLPNGGTRYVTEDLIEGLLNPVVSTLFGSDVGNGFDGVAASLKAYAEAKHNKP
ncbi:MAG TPA: SRPBCC family protein [Polyangiales bacterium]